jgi:hypothetical protein
MTKTMTGLQNHAWFALTDAASCRLLCCSLTRRGKHHIEEYDAFKYVAGTGTRRVNAGFDTASSGVSQARLSAVSKEQNNTRSTIWLSSPPLACWECCGWFHSDR